MEVVDVKRFGIFREKSAFVVREYEAASDDSANAKDGNNPWKSSSSKETADKLALRLNGGAK